MIESTNCISVDLKRIIFITAYSLYPAEIHPVETFPPLLASISLSTRYPIFLFLQLPLISTCHVQLSCSSLYCKFVPLSVSHLSPIFIVVLLLSYHSFILSVPSSLFHCYHRSPMTPVSSKYF